MASNTEHLDLLMKDPIADKDDTFNIETMLNENWRIIDLFAGFMLQHASRHAPDGADPLSPEDIGAASTETYTAIITTAWIADGGYYYQDISLPGIKNTDNPIVDILTGEDNAANVVYAKEICKIFRVVTSNDKVRAWATGKPSVAIPIQLKVVR